MLVPSLTIRKMFKECGTVTFYLPNPFFTSMTLRAIASINQNSLDSSSLLIILKKYFHLTDQKKELREDEKFVPQIPFCSTLTSSTRLSHPFIPIHQLASLITVSKSITRIVWSFFFLCQSVLYISSNLRSINADVTLAKSINILLQLRNKREPIHIHGQNRLLSGSWPCQCLRRWQLTGWVCEYSPCITLLSFLSTWWNESRAQWDWPLLLRLHLPLSPWRERERKRVRIN